MEELRACVPPDRRVALASGQDLPERTAGAALYADVTGFTPLAESMVSRFGPRQGAEELTALLNMVYTTLVAYVEDLGGSVIGFSGDAM